MTTPDENFTALETEIAEVVGILLETFSAEDVDENHIDSIAEGIGRYAQQVERIGSTAGLAGFVGLQDVCLLFQENLVNLGLQCRMLTENEQEKLEEWPTLVISYVTSPSDTQTVDGMIQHLQSSVWNKPLSKDEADVLTSLLLPPLECAEEATDEDDAKAMGDEIPSNEAANEMMPAPLLAAPTQENQEACEEAEDEIVQTLTSLQHAQQEILEVLCLEVTQIAEAAEDILDLVVSDSSDASRQEALLNYAELVSRYADASAAVGLQGLYQVCCQIQVNLNQFAQQNEVISLGQRQVVESWPDQVLPYLQALTDSQISDNLVRYLQNEQWPSPLPAAQAVALRELLVAPALTVEAAEVETRQQQATTEDISLAVPDDVNPELLDSLLQELPIQAAEFSAAIQRLSQGEGTLQDVDVAQRVAHTLKGAGNTVGVRGIATLTHHVEDILLALAKHKAFPTQALTETLLSAADCLETMSEALVGVSAPPPQAQAVLQEVLDWANRIDREGLAASNDTKSPVQQSAATPVPASTAPAETPSSTPTVPMLRVPATLVDDLLRLVGESVILTGQLHEQVRKTMRHTRAVQKQNLLFQQLTGELEQLVEIQNLLSPLSRPLPAGNFDPLELEQYNELNTVTHRLLEVATDARELGQNVKDDLATLDTLLVSQRRLQRENQETVLRTRMVPVKTVVPRLQRSVRQTCRLTDKEAELQVSGAETLMDSNVLNDLVDPLMHLLRNAVDHGIERHALRKELGKDPKGRIMLTFAREGNRIVVRCQDDGAGLDWVAIRRTAEQQGLLSPEKSLEEEELSRLILLPGFSTRTDATQTSGRGIGMDAVYSRVQEIKGSLSIQSQPGEGCRIELRLPLTLISTHALLVRMGEQRFAISDRGIKQILYPGSGQMHKLGGIITYQAGDEIYELSMLAALLQLPAGATAPVDSICPLLLVQDESGAVRAVLVEEVLDSRDMVVKSLGQYLPKLAGIVGATILGDGSVIPVLDLPELLRISAAGYGLPAAVARTEAVQESSTRHQRSALVVDDSLSARRALAQFIEDAGFMVRTAKDGLEAIEMIDSERPDLLLVDMEMPRMNGLELTSHVRANAVTRHLPVIMITSRSTDKHRREAKVAGVTVYLTKPFAEDELLEHIGQVLEQA